MPGGTRASARIASQNSSSPPSQTKSSPKTAGSKRKSNAGTSPSAKRGKKSTEKEQKTIEDTLLRAEEGHSVADSSDAKEAVNQPAANDVEKNGENLENTDGSKLSAQEDTATADLRHDTPPKANGAASSGDQNGDSQDELISHANGVDDAKLGETPTVKATAESTHQSMDSNAPKLPAADSKTQSDENSTDVAMTGMEAAAEMETETKLDEIPIAKSTTKEPSDESVAAPVPAAQSTQTPVDEPSKLANTSFVQEGTNNEEPAGDPSKAAELNAVQEDKVQLTKTDGLANGSERAVESDAREAETPSSILEKGIIYFFFRGRVGIDEPEKVDEIARSYMIMRPLPHGAKLGDGIIGDDGNSRLLILPKKILPKSSKDRFLCFVEKSKTTFKDIKDSVLSSSDYMTQTAGARHSPSATPVAEGVYAITTTGRESHLTYILTIPSELGEVQKDMGFQERNSFVTSVKNPQYSGSAEPGLSKGADYPKDILDEFRSLRWIPLHPKLLDYENTQFILIGESKGIETALEPQKEDTEAGKNTPMKEMEKLEGEDEIRVNHLNGDDAVFADLGLSSQEYSKVPSTW